MACLFSRLACRSVYRPAYYLVCHQACHQVCWLPNQPAATIWRAGQRG
jgi:hypothetical protein